MQRTAASFGAAFFPFDPDAADGPVAGAAKGSSRGRMSIRKSNWSDLLTALAMSARESVRRLFESAMMNARAVISAMKTSSDGESVGHRHC